MKRFINVCIVLSVFLMACSKSSSNTTTDIAPANLIVKAIAATDSSGTVSLIATADNAISYDFDFGNGSVATFAAGTGSYKYTSSGTYTINVIAKSASGQTISASTTVAVAVKLNLYWSDEFNTNGAPDATKWVYDLGTGSGGWGNNELEYYTNRSQNVFVQNGLLNITAMKESYNGSAYTSARLLTKGLVNFTYGHVDIRAKIPGAQGTWPALWMLGSNIDAVAWPACGEMDIMEHNSNNPNLIYGTLHYPGHSGANGNGSTITVNNVTADFHIYSLDWSASSIKIYVDNQLFQTVPNSAGLPFNQNFFFIFNLAMGGTFGGTVDPAFTSATMQVDYVRVYK